jgi:hypothetical protein
MASMNAATLKIVALVLFSGMLASLRFKTEG